MAATLTGNGELTYWSFPIEKLETTPDGDVYVYGKASDGSVDSDEQIVDPDWMAKAVQDWLASGANVRVQHNAQRDPAGIGVEAETDPDGATWVKSLVVEPVAKRLVEKGALRAYSVGIARPTIVRDNVARGGRIVDGSLCEISLVDRPANKNCTLQLVKAAKDGAPEWVGKVFGDELLTKTATVEEAGTVSVDLPTDVSVSFSPADLAKLLAHKQLAEKRAAEPEAVKRDYDPDTGGGVDRDEIPAEDFAGKDRSFPIVTPGDVSDAASSIGRAGDDNYSADTLKGNIISIAQRKGPDYVAELPDSWQKEKGIGKYKGNKKDKAAAGETGKVKKKGKKKPWRGDPPFEGAAPPYKEGNSGDQAPKPGPAKKSQGPDAVTVAKGMKDCPGCGHDYDADSKMRRCEGCGKKLPKANKTDEASTVKKQKVMCPGCGANVHDKHNFCPECGKPLAGAEPIKKNHDYTCLGCGQDLDKGEKFCPGCGKPNPGYLPEADSKVKAVKPSGKKGGTMAKKGKPTPGGGVVGEGAAGIKPVPAHREPDGQYVEDLEHDAGLPTVPDREVEMKAAMRLKSLGVPADMGAIHDLLCAAYHPADAAKAHPTVQLSGMDVSVWQQKALNAAYGAPMAEAAKSAQLWQHAVTVKGTPLDILDGLRDEAHKAFKDANPGPATFPKPTELSATSFRRPYISDGHAAPSPGHEGPNTAKVPDDGIQASEFDRDYLQAGHAADSPSNKSAGVIPAPVPAGAPQRTYYTNAQRDSARSAMAAMHDHIAQTFPDLCPMSGPGVGGEPPVGARPVPTPAGASKVTAEPTAAKVASGKKQRRKPTEAGALTKAVAPDPELVKSAVSEATASLATQLAEITKAFKAERKRSRKLAEAVDALGNLPDPATAPFRGVAVAPVTKSSAPPVGTPTASEVAERTQFAVMRAMQEQARTSPDPAAREAAWAQLYKMSGLTPQ